MKRKSVGTAVSLVETEGASKEEFVAVAAVISTEIISVINVKKFVSKRSSKRPLRNLN
ncbi:MAG: hypothetical protein GYA02_02040 [Clostridiaceae bacterium]|nr:hypothetical protein [Clostridiaceae bacterium]